MTFVSLDSAPDSSPVAAHPVSALTPDAVLDALASVGLYGDGRLLALSSYENRVYQAALEDGTRVVAKFYRPGRWSTAHILEEHAFATELAVAEVPVVAPLLLHGATLHQHAGFAFSVSPWRGGRLPELDDFEVLEWLGRFIARTILRCWSGWAALSPACTAWGQRGLFRCARRWTCSNSARSRATGCWRRT